MSLSVVIVCKNNESTIGRTLKSVAGLATEIVALDSGSTDSTIALLEREGARVERVEWKGHIATKQTALEAATSDWVLSLDSDESVEPDLARSLREFLSRDDPTVAAARVNRKTWFAGRPLNHCWQPEWRLRLVRRADVEAGLATWGGLNPHDKLEVSYRGSRQPTDAARAGRGADFGGPAGHAAARFVRWNAAAPGQQPAPRGGLGGESRGGRPRRELLEAGDQPGGGDGQADGDEEPRGGTAGAGGRPRGARRRRRS
ncbi:MAG: glycosyltransferase family 2 protein [Planctomycetota bacterium]|nr:MAG: glycosyltransferase family 2 protein [Planctomycetota bacterium]